MDLIIRPASAAAGLDLGSQWDPSRPSAAGFVAVADAAAAAGAQEITIAAHPASQASDAAAVTAGFEIIREMLQLRRALPVETDPPLVAVRAFRPGRDDQRWLEVNHRAFAWHPDQGSWTATDLTRHMAEPWFEPGGFLVHDDELTGNLDAFCWTKVHPATDHEPPTGEIFVIAVDPDAHGRGLGKAMVVAGLHYLHSLGLTSVMLYVEADNHVGRSLYAALGFDEHERHRWYRRFLVD